MNHFSTSPTPRKTTTCDLLTFCLILPKLSIIISKEYEQASLTNSANMTIICAWPVAYKYNPVTKKFPKLEQYNCINFYYVIKRRTNTEGSPISFPGHFSKKKKCSGRLHHDGTSIKFSLKHICPKHLSMSMVQVSSFIKTSDLVCHCPHDSLSWRYSHQPWNQSLPQG